MDGVEEEQGYGIGAVARRLGVPAPTLRTWNLRYGIGPSRRSPGGHRRYDAADVLRLAEMNRLIHAGVAPAEAATQALRLRPHPAPPLAPPPAPPEPARSRADAVPTAAMLARAATALDGRSVSEGIAAALARNGIVWTWERLVRPVFDTLCRRQARTGAAIEVEHLFSDRLLAALAPLTDQPARPVNARPVLLACAEDEQHSLPVYALAATLSSEHGVQTRILGARTPYSALTDAVRGLGPAVVFVWSQTHHTGDPAPLATLPAVRPPARTVVGGPGWPATLPAGVVHVTSLDEAVATIVSILG
ncbi:MerR family transcriptional regulator [Nonomuraea sp. NPDC050643]|uniref:MerR family transcriptional regulator n=1 Tax=Nonomuraea sp. NPDC050643 TaxID=3155660 RepID=UPI0033CB59DC